MGPGEQPPPHEAEEEEDDEGGDDLQSMVLMPPSVASELHCMEVNCYRAENLPKMDTCNCFFFFFIIIIFQTPQFIQSF